MATSGNDDSPHAPHGGAGAASGAGDDPIDETRARSRLEQLLPDVVKRAVYAGLGAVFSTEEGIRKMASDFHLPKDVVNFLIQQAASSKDELLRIVAKELRSFLSTINLNQELQKLLTSLSFEIKTEVRFIPNDEAIAGVTPDIKNKFGVKKVAREDRGGDKGGERTGDRGGVGGERSDKGDKHD